MTAPVATSLSPFMSVEEVAAFLHVSPGTVRWWRKQGLLPPAHKFGARVLWRREDIEAWAQARREQPARKRVPVVQWSRESFLKGLGG